MRRVVVLAAVLAVVCLADVPGADPRPPVALDGAHIRLELEKLRVTGTALYIAAHPDDENTAMLVWLANGRKVRTGYLAMTRGDGGQNLIGSDVGDRLGVIRTQELLAARRVDDAEQFFTRAIDFGFSKGPDETLAIWGRDSILADVVRVIRELRPDVIITRFATDGSGGHGHHTASAILAEEAFAAAADPARFPDQLHEGLEPWQAKRLVWNAYRFGGAGPDTTPGRLHVDLGAYDPLLGRSSTERAGPSRCMHTPQGFGAAERRGSWENSYAHGLGDPATN
ncbi:MAG: PIG-L family deacetylase, partial [Candidatus Eisenbacteria bacterium]